MAKAIWNGKVIAESNQCKVLEGNCYFPPNSINSDYFQETDEHTICPWKGTASYYDIEVDGKRNQAAAWYYPNPSASAQEIKDYIAFWKGVEVIE